jgi:DNA modification methylase
MPKIAKREKIGVTSISTELRWKDKRTEVDRIILPFQPVEVVNEPREKTLFTRAQAESPWRNKLIWGDNKYIMASLVAQFAGKINLIYIDPPFATGANFDVPVKVGDLEWTKEQSVIEELAYRDTWGKGLDSYLQMMYDRLVLMRELLADDGSIYVHLGWEIAPSVKLIMDEIFGQANLQNQIVYNFGKFHASRERWRRDWDVILFYTKSDKWQFNHDQVLDPYLEKTDIRFDKVDEEGRRYKIVKGQRFYMGEGTTPSSVWRMSNLQLNSVEYLGFPTQKTEELLTKVVKASSNEGDLVADFFCGSGTTGAVAEKLGRQWIMADLSKWAIHITRKRLLDIPHCNPFEILNLGSYEKYKFRENGIESRKKYIKFILQLYRAEPLSGCRSLHGKKAGRMVHIGEIDSIVTAREVTEALKECSSIGARGLDVLGWDFEMGLNGIIDQIGSQYGVQVKPAQIPREATEVIDPARAQLRFFDLNYLDLEYTVRGKDLTISLKDFVIANPEYVPEEVKARIKRFTDYIDYWAVDFDYKNDTFTNGWQSFRTRKHPILETHCHRIYDKPGKYQVLVKVVDIFGNDTNNLIEVTTD